MFADDTNLFFTHKDIRYLFQIVNQELENINQWFISNKLSLNIYIKKNTHFSIKPVKKKTLTLLLPKLAINNYEVCEVLLDENLSWKKHIKYSRIYVIRTLRGRKH